MKRVLFFPSLLLVGLFCTGCWPLHITSSPGASGIVLDRQTRQAVSGAQVVVSRTWQREWPNYGLPTLDEALENTRPPLVVTGSNGQFFIPPERKWIMAYPPPGGPARGTLIVRQAGYAPALVPLVEDLPEDAGTVLLTPVARQP
jgi:hypothetical protein